MHDKYSRSVTLMGVASGKSINSGTPELYKKPTAFFFGMGPLNSVAILTFVKSSSNYISLALTGYSLIVTFK